MNSFTTYTQQEIWDLLPLSEDQRKIIIRDFIETDKYDKIPKKKMTFEDMKTKEELEEENLKQ